MPHLHTQGSGSCWCQSMTSSIPLSGFFTALSDVCRTPWVSESDSCSLCSFFFFFFKACTGDTQAFRSRIHLTEGKEGTETGEAKVHLSTVVSSQRSLGKRTQTVLQECAAIFRLFTADAVSPAGSHTPILSHSALTLSAALPRSRRTIWDRLTQALTPLLRTASSLTEIKFCFC